MDSQNKNNPYPPDLKSLASCLNNAQRDGFTESFKATNRGLHSLERKRTYSPEEVEIVNFYRFEGYSAPEDNAILYLIKTNDGAKGTLVDAYGPYADPKVSQFITEVETIHKKVENK